MRSYYYSSGRTAILALLAGLMALGYGKLWYDRGGAIALAFTLVLLLGTIKLTFDAMGNGPALKFDGHSIWIRRTWGGLVEVPWGDVHDISTKVLTMRYMDIIPVSRTAYLTVTCEGGLFGARRFRLSTTALGLSVPQTAELEFVLKKVRLDAVGEVGVAMAGAGKYGWGIGPAAEPAPAAESFDADAAIARYLAEKQGMEPVPNIAPPPVRPAVRPTVPQRAAFGRRVS